jgi:hypothetical protein
MPANHSRSASTAAQFGSAPLPVPPALHVHAGAIVSHVLTRRQVARRLGKSVATVRRIEGILLHPVQDWRGVYRFDVNDVESLVHDVAIGEVRLCVAMGSRLSPRSRIADGGAGSERRMPGAREGVVPGCSAHEDLVTRLRDENATLRTLARSACSIALDLCSPAQLRELGQQLCSIMLELGEGQGSPKT